jgi:hypothetical protein
VYGSESGAEEGVQYRGQLREGSRGRRLSQSLCLSLGGVIRGGNPGNRGGRRTGEDDKRKLLLFCGPAVNCYADAADSRNSRRDTRDSPLYRPGCRRRRTTESVEPPSKPPFFIKTSSSTQPYLFYLILYLPFSVFLPHSSFRGILSIHAGGSVALDPAPSIPHPAVVGRPPGGSHAAGAVCAYILYYTLRVVCSLTPPSCQRETGLEMKGVPSHQTSPKAEPFIPTAGASPPASLPSVYWTASSSKDRSVADPHGRSHANHHL